MEEYWHDRGADRGGRLQHASSVRIGRGGSSSAMAISLGDAPEGNEASETKIDR